MIIVKHRALVMFLLFTLFLLGFDPSLLGLSEHVCIVVAASIHFLALALFAWTLLEGVQLYKSLKANKLTDTDSTKYSNLLRYLVGYGLPLVTISITLLVSQALEVSDSFIHEGYCWLKEKTWIYFFAGPVAVVLIINTFIFITALRVASKAMKRLNTSNTVKVFGQMKNWFILCFLLGLTWACGFMIQPGTEFMAYIFVILSGSSGIFLFVHTVLMNEVILLEVKIFLGLTDKSELAVEHNSSRILASKSKSFIRERPAVRRRPDRQVSTSRYLPHFLTW